MKLDVRLFAGLRELVGEPTLAVDLPEDGTVADLLRALERTPLGGMPDRAFIVAVNRTYATPRHPVRAGDEVALVPPVSGGAGAVRHVRIVEERLDGAALLDVVRDPRAGAVVLFEGATREVTHLHYEAYAEMAEPLVRAIGEEEAARHGLIAVAVEHRVGRVPLSEAAVLVAVSSGHRGEAFAGAKAIMDRIKAEAPIFKQEEGDWVGELPAT
jgi:molybdopterin synthase catalytic subunit